MKPQKPLPEPSPETQPYWDGLRNHELRIQRCKACGLGYFYPRPFCPRPGCHSRDVEWFTASGNGKLHSYVIAVVELAEGGRMMTNIVGLEDPTPDQLPIDADVEIVYDDVSTELTLPMFRLK